MAYMPAAQLVAASDVAELGAASPEQQATWWAMAKRAIEGFCGQRFDADVGTRNIDGNDQRRLPLDKRLATLTGIAISAPGFPTSLDLTDVALDDDHDAIHVIPDALTGGTWATRVLREGRRAVFPAGAGTVAVTGTWGWLDAELPPDDPDTPVNIAMRLEMEDLALAKSHGLAQTIRANTRLGLTGTADGRINADIKVPDIVLGVESQSLLEDYIWHPPGG